ncbi:pyridoxal 5'-phosphate synthase glutaminase subunit PdxT [Corynebacterium aurimucosum]|uniref:pyridoxal 5'-phosphate synthase glutaminase subunit PdxT n=1 Tax=Corynebacterium aurimucosum TaxID=169292 RepID=UPI000C805FE6|nr:pyridoxal 5'-phosphate synthase glutaminase subunit PdxT [Corynebacterium aurimucosum]PMC70091.1 pyridoxal 5'-phosphate synthase glutaminase subunit PdxT [Corynebacterium aurimucosum]
MRPHVGVLALQGGVEEHLAVVESLGAATRRVRLPQDLDGLDGIILPGGESSTIDKLARSFGVAEPLRRAVEGGLPVLATCAGLIYSARELENPAPGQQTLGLIDVTVRRNAFGNQRFSQERIVPVAMQGQRPDAETSEVGARRRDAEAHGIGPRSITLDIEASFIRAPIVTRVGDGVEVIATLPAPALGSVAGGATRAGGAISSSGAISAGVGGKGGMTHADCARHDGAEVIVGVQQGRVTALSFHPEENGDSRLHAAWLASFAK